MLERTLTNVYVFQNGMVMAFDQDGVQMPEFQGHLDEVRDKLEAAGHVIPVARNFSTGAPV